MTTISGHRRVSPLNIPETSSWLLIKQFSLKVCRRWLGQVGSAGTGRAATACGLKQGSGRLHRVEETPPGSACNYGDG